MKYSKSLPFDKICPTNLARYLNGHDAINPYENDKSKWKPEIKKKRNNFMKKKNPRILTIKSLHVHNRLTTS